MKYYSKIVFNIKSSRIRLFRKITIKKIKVIFSLGFLKFLMFAHLSFVEINQDKQNDNRQFNVWNFSTISLQIYCNFFRSFVK